jgi:hypothetical protein
MKTPKSLQKILDFGYGLIHGSAILQAREINRIDKKQEEIKRNMRRRKGIDYNPENKRISSVSCVIGLTELYGLFLLSGASISLSKGDLKKAALEPLVYYIFVKELTNYSSRRKISLGLNYSEKLAILDENCKNNINEK